MISSPLSLLKFNSMFDLIWMSNFLLPLSLICSEDYQYFLRTVTHTDFQVSLSTQILFLILSRTLILEKHLSMLFQPLFYLSHLFPAPFLPTPISSLLPPLSSFFWDRVSCSKADLELTLWWRVTLISGHLAIVSWVPG